MWKPWFFEFGGVDIAINSYENGVIIIENKDIRPVPVQVTLHYQNETIKEVIYSSSVWKDTAFLKIEVPDYDSIKSISINRDIVDQCFDNNFYPSMASELKLTHHAIADDLLGTYKFKETDWHANITIIDGIMYISYIGLNYFLKPLSETKYESLGGKVKLQFLVDGDVCKGFILNDFWGDWTAEKQ